jgi:hypothetical protein
LETDNFKQARAVREPCPKKVCETGGALALSGQKIRMPWIATDELSAHLKVHMET